jgi:hypothetical protein
VAQSPPLNLSGHLIQARRNEEIARWLFNIGVLDWGVVILFYAAVRYAITVEMHLSWNVSRSHSQRMAQLRQKGHPHLADLYMNAYEISRKWRYQMSFIPQLFPEIEADWRICEQCVNAFKQFLASHGIGIL